MTAQPAGEPRPRWSVGSDNFDVYRDRKLFASCTTQANAAEIVAALNAAETRAAQPPSGLWPKCQWCRAELEKFARTAGKCPHCGALQFEPRDTLPAAAQPGDAPKLTGPEVAEAYHNSSSWEVVAERLNALLASRSTPAAPAALPSGEGTQG